MCKVESSTGTVVTRSTELFPKPPRKLFSLSLHLLTILQSTSDASPHTLILSELLVPPVAAPMQATTPFADILSIGWGLYLLKLSYTQPRLSSPSIMRYLFELTYSLEGGRKLQTHLSFLQLWARSRVWVWSEFHVD